MHSSAWDLCWRYLLRLSLKVGKSRGLLEYIWFPLLVSLAILGYPKTQIGPTKILEMRTLTVEEARELGCPVENKDYFDGGEIIGLRFEPFNESLPCCVLLRLAPNMGVENCRRSCWVRSRAQQLVVMSPTQNGGFCVHFPRRSAQEKDSPKKSTF